MKRVRPTLTPLKLLEALLVALMVLSLQVLVVYVGWDVLSWGFPDFTEPTWRGSFALTVVLYLIFTFLT